MGAFFIYILKTAVCLSAFYLFYRLLLSRETFHRFNRLAVLGILLVSLLIPFCEISVKDHGEVQQAVLSIEQLLLLADATENIPAVEAQTGKAVWMRWLILIYLAGVLFFVGRNLYSLVKLCVLLKSGKREKLEGDITLIIHDKPNVSPFSWIKYIVSSRKDLEENGREILIHEMAHIRRRHSIDLFMADVCIFFQWFNPAVWLLKQELQNIHEYEADETVINEGVDAKQYQLLLIKKAVGTRLYSMAYSFNHSKLKKRITMMLKEKSSPWARLKYLYVLPLAAIAVSAFARPEISTELKEISAFKVNDLTAIVEKNTEENNPKKQKEKKAHLELTGAIISVKNGNPIIEADEVTLSSPQDRKESGFEKLKDPLIIVDGKEIPNADLNKISPADIHSLDVLRDKSAVELYGEKGANGVIRITLMTEAQKKELTSRPKSNLLEIARSELPADALVIIDGKEATVKEMNKLNPEKVGSISIFKPSDENSEEVVVMFRKYSDKAKNGIIMVNTQKDDRLKGTPLIRVGEKANP